MKKIFIISCFCLLACQHQQVYKKNIPVWTKDAIVYEVNVRQFTPEGTFKAFSDHLPRIKDLGVDIIWFMPIHPIGKKNRKGSLGSYYSVKDYKAINPEFGTLEEFNELVRIIHDMGMKVIIDWVANHSAFDNVWIEEGKLDWYTLDSTGNLQPPLGTDWWDVADLNYNNMNMRKEMIECMKFWINTSDIDGFRCDVADWVPIEFWNECREELDQIKEVFMLAEAENPELHHRAFDMTYAWHFHFVMNEIAKENKSVLDIFDYLESKSQEFPKGAYRLHFTSNHDENSWKGDVYERLGDAVKTFAALSVTLEGMPLLYNGQEAGLNKRLEFFEKDTISWEDLSMSNFYRNIFKLKKENQALWNGKYGGDIEVISSKDDSLGFCFIRQKDNNKVISVFNLSNQDININIKSNNLKGDYTRFLSGDQVSMGEIDSLTLSPWEFRIYTNKK